MSETGKDEVNVRNRLRMRSMSETVKDEVNVGNR